MFFRSSEETEVGSGKEHEDIMFRRVPREVAMRYRAAAGGRGMTHAQYLTALVELHARIRAPPTPGTRPPARHSTSSGCRPSPSELGHMLRMCV